MSLLQEAMTDCVFLEKVRQPDGEGGYITVWSEGATFQAAITLDTSIEAKIAFAQGVTGIYTITTEKALTLEYHDVFRRKSDGKIFRVTSDGDDNKTPNSAHLNMRQVSAEEWSVST